MLPIRDQKTKPSGPPATKHMTISCHIVRSGKSCKNGWWIMGFFYNLVGGTATRMPFKLHNDWENFNPYLTTPKTLQNLILQCLIIWWTQVQVFGDHSGGGLLAKLNFQNMVDNLINCPPYSKCENAHLLKTGHRWDFFFTVYNLDQNIHTQ